MLLVLNSLTEVRQTPRNERIDVAQVAYQSLEDVQCQCKFYHFGLFAFFSYLLIKSIT
jgi:hypothetical protein